MRSFSKIASMVLITELLFSHITGCTRLMPSKKITEPAPYASITQTPFQPKIEKTATLENITILEKTATLQPTVDKYILDILNQNGFQENKYIGLPQEQFSSINYLASLDKNLKLDIFIKQTDGETRYLTPESAIALSDYLQRVTPEEQKLILSSSLNPIKFIDADAYVVATYDMSPIHVSILTDAFRRTGLKVIIDDMTSPSTLKHSAYKEAQTFFLNDDGTPKPNTLAAVAERTLDNIMAFEKTAKSGDNASFEDGKISVYRNYALKDFMELVTEKEAQEKDPLILYYLTHMHLDKNVLIGSTLYEYYEPEDILPESLLDTISGRPLITFIDSCPAGFIDKLDKYISNYNSNRLEEEKEALEYIFIVGGKQGDIGRRIPVGDFIDTIFISQASYEIESTNQFYHPLLTTEDMNNIISGQTVFENVIESQVRHYMIRHWIRQDDKKILSPYIIDTYLLVESPSPGTWKEDNMAIFVETLTNMTLSGELLRKMTLTGMNLEYIR